MVSPGNTYVLDPEFSFYGPMGFDTGAFISNLLLNYVSQTVLSTSEDYVEWILEQINIFWNTFHDEFLRLWNDPMEHTGDAFQRPLLHDVQTMHLVQDQFMSSLLEETLGFTGMKMLRRIMGIAHVEDLECIGDVELKAKCEKHGLEVAKELIKNASLFTSIKAVTMMACDKKRLYWVADPKPTDEPAASTDVDVDDDADADAGMAEI